MVFVEGRIADRGRRAIMKSEGETRFGERVEKQSKVKKVREGTLQVQEVFISEYALELEKRLTRGR